MSTTHPSRSEQTEAARWSTRRLGAALLCAAMTAWCLILAVSMAWQHRWTDLVLVLIGTVFVAGASERLLIRSGRP